MEEKIGYQKSIPYFGSERACAIVAVLNAASSAVSFRDTTGFENEVLKRQGAQLSCSTL